MAVDKLHWFKFTPSDWMMGKIQRCPEDTQARFLRLCCLYWNKKCELSLEDAIIEIDQKHIDILVQKKVISLIEYSISIAFLDEQMDAQRSDSEEKSKSGAIGNLKRWNPDIYHRFISKELTLNECLELAKVPQDDRTPIAPRSQNIAEKKRIEENREEERRKDIDRRKHSFAESIKPFVSIYGRDMCNRFYDYWSEPNKSKTKIKWEMEKTWDIEKRLKRWSEPKFKPIQTANF